MAEIVAIGGEKDDKHDCDSVISRAHEFTGRPENEKGVRTVIWLRNAYVDEHLHVSHQPHVDLIPR